MMGTWRVEWRVKWRVKWRVEWREVEGRWDVLLSFVVGNPWLW